MTPPAIFTALTPTDVLDAAEAVIGQSAQAPVVACPSYINRVFRVDSAAGDRFIVKFYRPDRWTTAAIAAEHRFIAECAEAGLAVAAPLPDADGNTLHGLESDAAGGVQLYNFAVYPFYGGRGWEPERAADWFRLGERIAALHRVGRRGVAPDRPRVDPDYVGAHALDYLLAEDVVNPDCRNEFGDLCSEALSRMAPRFSGIATQRLHGDLHRGNLLIAPGAGGNGTGDEPLFIDFDDMATGPAVQDLWLFLPGRSEEAGPELAELLSGYETVVDFDHAGLELVEPLRFLRMLSYLAWQARQRADRGFPEAFPDWGGRAFWIKEIEDFRDQARFLD